MKRPSNFTGEHFSWLVEGRSQNQRSTLALYQLIEDYEDAIAQNLVLHAVAQSLAAVAFSLWRAVFLSDLTGAAGDQLIDLKLFLQSLIAHNTVLYQTDFSTREWSFQYYLDNATYRLRQLGKLSDGGAAAVGSADADKLQPKDDWSNAQAALDLAIANFAKALADHDPS